MIEQAFQTDYYTSKWISITNWAEICPKGPGDRLPRDKKRLGDHDCFYLTMRDIAPEDWQVPTQLTRQPANVLPAARPMLPEPAMCCSLGSKNRWGNALSTPGRPAPLYVSSNFVLLRPKSEIDPYCCSLFSRARFLLASCTMLSDVEA